MVTTDELNNTDRLEELKEMVDYLMEKMAITDYSQIEKTLREEDWSLAIRPGEKETTYFYLSDKGEFGYASLGIGTTVKGIEDKLKQANEYGGLPHQLNDAYTIRGNILYLKEPYTDISSLID